MFNTVEASYEANKTLSIPQQQQLQQNDEIEQPQVEKALTWVTKPNPRSSFLTKTYIEHRRTVYIIQTCLIIEPGTMSKSYNWLKRRLRRTSPSRFSISAVMAANNELFPEPTFPITPISCPCKKRKKLFNFLLSKGRALRLLLYIAIFCYGNSEFMQQDGRKETTAKRLSVTNVTGLLLACFVGSSLNIDVFCSSTKRSV